MYLFTFKIQQFIFIHIHDRNYFKLLFSAALDLLQECERDWNTAEVRVRANIQIRLEHLMLALIIVSRGALHIEKVTLLQARDSSE